MKLTLLLSCFVVMLLVTSHNTASAQTLISHSNSQVPTAGSVSCNAGGITRDNRYFREYDLATDFAIPGAFQIDSVQFGIEQITAAPVGGFPVAINLYSIAAPGMPSGVLTLVATDTAYLADQALTTYSHPISYLTTPGEVIVVEIDIASSTTTQFFIGSNAGGQTDAGYILSDSCGIANPTDIAAIGFPNMHIIINLISAPAVVPVSVADFGSNAVCFGNATMFSDSSMPADNATTYAWDFDGDGNTDSTTVGSVSYTFPMAGTYNSSLILTDTAGTADTAWVTTVVYPTHNDTMPAMSICMGDSALIWGMYQTMSGMYSDTLQNMMGCDSIVNVMLMVYMPTNDTMPAIDICMGDSAMIWGMAQTMAGMYSDTLQNMMGCDSIVNVMLNVMPAVDTSVTINGTMLNSNAAGALVSYQWVNCADTTIVGSGPSYTPTVTGNYAVIVTDNGCSAMSACYNVTVLGLETIANAIRFELYPNPNNGDFNLELANNSNTAQVEILNALGQVIQSNEYNNGTHVIKLGDVPSGIYIVRVQNGKDSAQKQLIIR